MFQLNNEYVTDISQIYLPFKNLSEIHQWGGDFYADKVNKFIEDIGHQLKVLYFIHVGKNFWIYKIFKHVHVDEHSSFRRWNRLGCPVFDIKQMHQPRDIWPL